MPASPPVLMPLPGPLAASVWQLETHPLQAEAGELPHAPLALTLGNFDGLHLGHQALLDAVVHQASRHGARPALLTFAPHPGGVLGGAPPPLLITREHLLHLLRRRGLWQAFFLRFSPQLAQVEAEDFVLGGLLGHFNLRALVVGEDFGFGRGRSGDAALLRRLGAARGLTVQVLAQQRGEGTVISSSRIRRELAAGQLAAAARLLGRPYGLLGPVLEGQQRGRQLGFATLNLGFSRPLPLPYGVYAARVRVAGGWHDGISNYGVRPTLAGAGEALLETHVFDFSREVYGQASEVRPLHFLRQELRFPCLEALKAQIARDCAQARSWLAAAPPWARGQEWA